jgi:hypothetical protein
VLIELEEWDHKCGDDCCYYTYETNIYIKGLLTAVLNKLGYTNVTVEYK